MIIIKKKKKEVKLKQDKTYMDDYLDFKLLSIEVIDKVIEFLVQAKKMMK